MDCKLIRKGRESILYNKLIDKLGKTVADIKLIEFESATFLNDFGDYLELMENELDFISEIFKGRLNEFKEPEIFEDNNGIYYLDKEFNKKYLDIVSSELFTLFKSERAINTLTELVSSNYVNEGGFKLDFSSLDLTDKESTVKLSDFIKTYLKNLGEELTLSENDDIFTNGVILLNILNNKKALNEIEEKVKNYFKTRNLEYNEEINEEDLDIDESEIRDPGFQKASFEINTKSKVRAGVKLRLSLITNPSNIDPDFGKPKPIDYDALYRKLTVLLKDNPVMFTETSEVIDQFESMINILEKHSTNIKSLSTLIDYLKKINTLDFPITTTEGILLSNFKSGFVNAFNLQKNNFGTSSLESKEVIVERGKTEQTFFDDGRVKGIKKISEDIKGEEYKFNTFDATKETNARKDVLNNWSLSLKNKLELPEDVRSSFSPETFKTYQAVLKRLELLNNNKLTNKKGELLLTPLNKSLYIKNDLLPYFGIIITDEVFNLAMNNFNNVSLDVNDLNKNYNVFIDNTTKTFQNIITNFQNKKQLFNTYSYEKLADAEVFYNEDGAESSIRTAGKQGKMTTKYGYSNPSNLHNQINTWKKDRNQLVLEYENLNSWEKESQLYKYLLALNEDVSNREAISLQRIKEFEIRHFNSFLDKTNSKAKQKDGSTISKSEYIKYTVNGLLASKISENSSTVMRTTTAPGKATQYELMHKMFVNSNMNVNAEGNINLKTVRDILYTYLKSEFTRMSEQYNFIQDKNNQLDVYYHTNKKGETGIDSKLIGNAFKSQLFPELSFNNYSKIITEYVKEGQKIKLYNDNGSINIENIKLYEDQIFNHIDKVILEKIELLKEDLLKYNIIEKSGTNTFINKGIDSRIWKQYSTSDYNITNENLNKLLGDIFINGLINHIEYSKVFAGDVAYYKDPTDYIKRIGATYSDGVYEYLTKYNKDYKVAIIESVNIREPYLEIMKPIIKGDDQLMEEWSKNDINSADAQAYITIKRWKSILLGVSKFTPSHEIVYKKLTGKINEPLTSEELKLVAQPLKGTYFNRTEKGKPIFLKYSQAVLIPQLIKNTPLNEIHELMKSNKADELVTFDGIKAGSIQTTKIHNELGQIVAKEESGKYKKLNVMTLNSKGWKLQQDLPTKTFKDTDIGSQILKNMLLLLSDNYNSNKKIFEYNNQTYTAKEMSKLIDTTLGQLVNLGYQKLLKEFDIDEQTGVIGNVDKFYNTLADELVSRDISDEVVKALRTGLSIYAFPGLKEKLDNIFASIVNDRTVKIKTNGGSFIQMSNFGLSKEEANLKHNNIKWSPLLKSGDTTKPYHYKLNEDGSIATNIFKDPIIQPNQILLSGSFIAKYIPDYEKYSETELFGTLNAETGNLEGGLIDNKILSNIIGYRIPNQGPSSNDALQVVGILPPGVGDVVVAFTGITKKTGSDFDIDKMYIMFPNYKEINGKLEYVTSDKNSEQSVQNKVIELYKTLILEKDNIKKIMTPLDHVHIKQEAQNLAPAKIKSDLDNFEFIQDIETKYSFLAGLAGVGQMANTSSDYAMGTLSNVYYKNVNLGTRSHQGESFEIEYVTEKGEIKVEDVIHSKFDEINSVKITKEELKEWVTSYNQQAEKHGLEQLDESKVSHYLSFPISDSISALMNAFVDIAKDPYITNVNWNMMTTNTGNMMLRAGVHPFIVTAFLAQPIINEYIDFVSTYESNKKTDQVSNTKDAFRIFKVEENVKDETTLVGNFTNGKKAEINNKILYNLVVENTFKLDSLSKSNFTNTKILNKIKSIVGLPTEYIFTEKDILNIESSAESILETHYDYFKNNDFKDFRINDSLGKLRNNVFNTSNKYQADIFSDFLKFQTFGKKVKASVDASKHSVNGMGKNTTSLLIAVNKVKNIESKGVINYNTKMKHDDGTKKLLGHNYDKLLNTVKIVQSNPLMFVSSSPFVWNSYNKISNDIYGENLENEELANKLDFVFKTYLMSGFKPLNLSNKEKLNLVKNFPKEFLEFKNSHLNQYKILDELKTNISNGEIYLGLTNKQNSKEYTDNMINSWKEMMKFYPEFSNKLIQYSFVTSGFNPSITSFYQYIPPSFFLQNNFNGYVKSFTNNFNNTDVDSNFIEQFYLSNLQDSQIVKFVSSNKKLQTQPYLKAGIVLFAKDVDKEFINVSKTIYKKLGINNKGENMYTEYLKTTDGFAKIQPIVFEIEKGIKVYNINSNELSLENDKTLSEEHKNFLNQVYKAVTYNTDTTINEDEFGQEDIVKKEELNVIETVESQNEVVENMNELINHSGGAKGGDMTWDSIGKEFGVTNHNHYTTKYFDNLSPEEQVELSQQYLETTKWLKRGVINSESYAGKLVRRDMIQANNSDAIFGITELVKPGINGRKGYVNKNKYSIPEGGTGYAVARGIISNKPTYVFNQSDNYGNEIGWYKWDNKTNDFIQIETPILTKNYAGIGSQEINEVGIQAIREVYQNTLENLNNVKTTEITNKSKQTSIFDMITTYEQIEQQWLNAGYTIEDWNNMNEEQREIIIENCL